MIEAKHGGDIMTLLDIPNAFVQTDVPQQGEEIVMKIQGQLIDMLIQIAPRIYNNYFVHEGKSQILYLQMLKALYGMLIASILDYEKFRKI